MDVSQLNRRARGRVLQRVYVMEATRFDALAKATAAEASRRRTFAGLIAGALWVFSLLAAEDPAVAKSRACKPPCPECTT